MFDYPKSSKAVYDNESKIIRYDHIDGAVVHILAKFTNFTPVYMTYDENQFGFQLPNGTLTGSLGALEYGAADLAGVDLTHIDRNTTNAVYFRSLRTVKFVFVIRRHKSKKSIVTAMSNTVDFVTKLILLICLIAFPIILFLMLKLKRWNRITFGDSVLMTVALIIAVNSRKISSSTSIRMFLTAVIFFALILTALFQGSIIKNLNFNVVVGDIKTLDQLLDNNYEILCTEITKSIFHNGIGGRMAGKINEIHMTVFPVLNFSHFHLQEKEAFLMSDIAASDIVNLNINNVTNEPEYKIVPEVFFEFYKAMMVQRSSPFQDVFNLITTKIIESGIQHHLMEIMKFEDVLLKIKKIREGEIPAKQNEAIELHEISTIFYVYLILNSIALTTFGLEHIFHRCINQFN